MATVVLKNFGGGDFTIADREFVVVTGPDEHDASAIVRGIAGLEVAPQTEILFDDRAIDAIPAKDRDVAFLSHDYEPYPRLSAYENLAMGLKRRQFGETEIRKRIEAVAQELGLQDRLEVLGNELSPAERALVGLARVMVRQPRVYLFDRPFARLAPTDASRGRAILAGLQQRSSATIIYATNDPAEALALDAHTVIIANGAIQQEGPARTVYDVPANVTVARFFGNPPMNLVQGAVKSERDGLVFVEAGEGTISLTLPTPRFEAAKAFEGKPAVLGFRPGSLEIAPSDGPSRPGSSFRALVDRAEPRGGQTDLYLRTGAHELICQTTSWEAQRGRRLHFAIGLGRAHLFDAETGLRATPAE